MVSKGYREQYEIHDKKTLEAAAATLSNASSEKGVIVILGNQACPVDIPDYDTYRKQIQSNCSQQLDISEVKQRYFAYLELQRLVTHNFIPNNCNLVCLLRLVRREIVKAIITTNYDGYISAAFSRYGQPYKCVMNPCMQQMESEGIDWDHDGYYSTINSPSTEIPLWKIHGDLRFVRMDECGHICSLPSFIINKIAPIQSSQPCSCHFAVFKEDGSQYWDPSLAREHPATSYQHHIDYGANRLLFQRESRAAKDQLVDHCSNYGILLIVGLRFNPRFPEDLTSILAKAPAEVPLIFVVASKQKIQASNSELLFRLQEINRDFILVNEVNDNQEIEHSLKGILMRMGEVDIDNEYKCWEDEGKWWVKL